jgi:arylsulfatase A-like enzyme
VRQVDWSRPIKDGPVDVGFDYFFGTVCCPTTDWLYAYIENDRVVEPPTKIIRPPQGNWLEYGYFRAGLIAPNFDMEQVDLVFLEKSVAWLEERANEPAKPFFLFHNTQTAHLPSIPAPRFVGKTPIGPHGDFVFEFDHIVGELMATLDRLDMADDTLVIVTSDNGPEIVTGQLREQHGHNSSGPYRGFKRDNWEAGHRVPFIARWPNRIPAGATSKHAINLTDLMATCAAIVNADLPADAAEDSRNILAELQGANAHHPGDHDVLHETMSLKLAIRRGAWKLLDHQGSGGNGYDSDYLKPFALPDNDPDAPAQLYNLHDDPDETTNLYAKQPDIAVELKRRLDGYVEAGRSVPAKR